MTSAAITRVGRIALRRPLGRILHGCLPGSRSAAATRSRLLPKLARENVVIAGPHMLFPSLGRLRKEGSGYTWAPVAFTDQWDKR